ncbi:transglycosylase SLT domain-containing protein [Burkholderia vietnamiensis]|uniref:transglycosylase SLT domain-containing protein n=1 Tax=Burkholderia vietnamiensis TaxID=60552 RepID=UPI0009C00A9A|nr:transglycosylase SLT domain-containing protein [Burkholderia vietnamiensis]
MPQMADYSGLFAASGAKYGVPPQLLGAIQNVESGAGTNPAVVGPAPAIGGDDRAHGIMQIMGANAKAAGINPNVPAQAVDWAARNLKQLYQKFGNWDDAVRAYHGGTNTDNWGPRTNSYYQKVSAKFGSQPQSIQGPQPMALNTQDSGLIDPFADATPPPQAKASPQRTGANQSQPQVTTQADQGLIDPFADAAPAPQPGAPAPPPQAQANQPGMLTSLGAGLGHGFGSTMLGAQQLLGKGLAQAPGLIGKAGNWLVNDATQGMKNLDTEYAPAKAANPITAAVGNIAGEIVPALALPGGAGVVGRIGSSGGRLAARTAIGAGQGAAMGAVQGVQNPDQNFAQQKVDQIKSGAIGGAIGAPVASAAGRVLAPVGSASINALRQAGITPSLGQMLGPVASNLEQKATSLPLVGNMINSTRQNAVSQFNLVVGNDALAPIGATLPRNVQAGADMVQHVGDRIGQEYQTIARNGRVVMDAPLQNDIASLTQGIGQDAPALAGRFQSIVNNQLLNKNGGNLSGDAWANTRSAINAQIRNHSGFNASSDDRVMVDYLQQLQDSITSNAEHYSNQSVRQQLGQANAAYARYKALEKAAGGPAAQKAGNVFTPSQLQSAIRSGQSAQQRATSSANQGFSNSQLANNAQSVLGNTVPDSGTAGRLGLMDLITGAGALHNPMLAAKGAALSLPYLPGVRNAVPALVASRPQAVRNLAPVVRQALPGMLGGLSAQQPPQQQNQGVLSGLLAY